MRLSANPNLAESQFAAGYVNWILDWDWPAAERALRLRDSARSRQPGRASDRSGTTFRNPAGTSEAAEAMRRARELGPLEPLELRAVRAGCIPGPPVSRVQSSTHVEPCSWTRQFWIGHMELAQVYAETGETDLAFEEMRDAARFSGGNSKAASVTGYLLAKIGKTSEAHEILRELEAASLERYVPPYAMALVHAGLGERDDVFEWLDKATPPATFTSFI